MYRDALHRAIELSRLCPPAENAFSVGAILLDAHGDVAATGYSRETDPKSHAEEIAIMKAKADQIDVVGGTMVCSLEPCGKRASHPQSCADLIINAGIKRVVYALAEPPKFVADPNGTAKLKAHGVEVFIVGELGPIVKEINGLV